MFSPGDKVTLDIDTAEKLIADGACKAVQSPLTYKRTLRNYPFLFRNSLSSGRELTDLAAKIQKDTQAVTASTQETKAQSESRQGEQTSLQDDLRHFQCELNINSLKLPQKYNFFFTKPNFTVQKRFA